MRRLRLRHLRRWRPLVLLATIALVVVVPASATPGKQFAAQLLNALNIGQARSGQTLRLTVMTCARDSLASSHGSAVLVYRCSFAAQDKFSGVQTCFGGLLVSRIDGSYRVWQKADRATCPLVA